MHELTAAQSILDIAVNEAARSGARRVTRVSVKCGQWSTFEPECLAFYFGVLSKGSPSEGAEIDVVVLPIRYRCADCSLEYEPVEGRFECPLCASPEGELIGGRELYVDSIEVVNADTCSPQSA